MRLLEPQLEPSIAGISSVANVGKSEWEAWEAFPVTCTDWEASLDSLVSECTILVADWQPVSRVRMWVSRQTGLLEASFTGAEHAHHPWWWWALGWVRSGNFQPWYYKWRGVDPSKIACITWEAGPEGPSSLHYVAVFQSLSRVWLFVTPWTAARQASLSFPPSGVCSNSCLLSQWYHSTISSSVIPFFSCLPSFPASRSFPMSQLFESGGQNIGVSASASVLPMSIQDWFPLGWTDWISLHSKGPSRVFYNTSAEILQHSTFCIDIQTHETRIPSYCNIKRSSLRHIISNCKKSLKKKEF